MKRNWNETNLKGFFFFKKGNLLVQVNITIDKNIVSKVLKTLEDNTVSKLIAKKYLEYLRFLLGKSGLVFPKLTNITIHMNSIQRKYPVKL